MLSSSRTTAGLKQQVSILDNSEGRECKMNKLFTITYISL